MDHLKIDCDAGRFARAPALRRSTASPSIVDEKESHLLELFLVVEVCNKPCCLLLCCCVHINIWEEREGM